MTKTRRVILLAVDIITILGGIAALIAAIAYLCHSSDFAPRTPTHEEIYAASITKLRIYLRLAIDDISFLSGTVQDWGDLLLFSGLVMFIGSGLRLVFTPWRLATKKNDAALDQ